MNESALNFSYDKDTPATLTVTFVYRKWIKNEKGPRDPPEFVKKVGQCIKNPIGCRSDKLIMM